MDKFTKLISTAVLLTAATTSHAIIINGAVTGGDAFIEGGNFVNLTVPFTESNPDNTVGNDTFQTPNLYGFNESQNTTVLDEALLFDLTVGGSWNNGGTNPGSLAVGTTVASHYVFFDPEFGTTMQGWVEFDADILAVIVSTDNLLASDYLANTGVTYQNPSLRGLEGGNPSQDEIINVFNRSIELDFYASTPGDYIRVLTAFSPGATVPEPSILALMSLGLVGLGISRRKRNQ